MARINKEEYEILKGLDVEWNWIARDNIGVLGLFMKKPKKYKLFLKFWSDNISLPRYIDDAKFQFIQWEDESPYNVQELIDEYESEYHIENAKIVKLDASKLVARDASDYKHFYKRVGESEESEVKDKEWLKDEIRRVGEVKHYIPDDSTVEIELPVLDYAINQLDEPEPKNISLKDVTHRLWELPLNDRKYWLEQLNDEFQEGYIVPLGLKTTNGEEQYLTLNGSYFASRRNEHLQQTFATLEEIPEFYRDLAERVL